VPVSARISTSVRFIISTVGLQHASLASAMQLLLNYFVQDLPGRATRLPDVCLLSSQLFWTCTLGFRKGFALIFMPCSGASNNHYQSLRKVPINHDWDR
jgi:hypothetical protein